MADRNREETEARILANEELVACIIESASQLSEPMSVDEFLEWLHTSKEKRSQRQIRLLGLDARQKDT